MKRLFDFCASFFALLLLSPILLLVSLAILIKMGRPIFFKQNRIGKGNLPFSMVKFRTMANNRVAEGNTALDKVRTTRLGNFLRKTSLDELPELWNILRGNMSLVGPRPLLVDYLPYYSDEEKRRHDVLPGLTGWAQVNGRNQVEWDQKLALDVWYVDHRSFWLDLKIICLTVRKVLKSEGVDQTGDQTAERFDDWLKKHRH